MATEQKKVPDSVTNPEARELYARCNEQRTAIKTTAEAVNVMRRKAIALPSSAGVDGEVIDNITLAYRHLEDASMRLGKALQALDGGVSVYDRATTVGA